MLKRKKNLILFAILILASLLLLNKPLIMLLDSIFQFSPKPKETSVNHHFDKWENKNPDEYMIRQQRYSDSIDNLMNPSFMLNDTTFTINSLKVHFKEILIARRESIYGRDSILVRLDVMDGNDSILQRIEQPIYTLDSQLNEEDLYYLLADSGLTLDYNFDGFEDLAIRIDQGNIKALNGVFYIFIFDSTTNTFQKYDEEFTNPIPIPAEKRIRCEFVQSTIGLHIFYDDYVWENGKLMLVESTEEQQVEGQEKNGIPPTKQTKIYYQNGKEVKRTENIIY